MSRIDRGSLWMKLEHEFCCYPEVSTTASYGKKEISILAVASSQNLAICSNDCCLKIRGKDRRS